MVHAILYSGKDAYQQLSTFSQQGHATERQWTGECLGDTFEEYLSTNVKSNDVIIISDNIFVNDDPAKLLLLKNVVREYNVTVVLSDSDLQISRASHNKKGRPQKTVPEIEIIVKKRKNKLITLNEALELSGMSRSAFYREMEKY